MKQFSKNDIRSGHLACNIIIITSLLLFLIWQCCNRNYTMPVQAAEVGDTAENTILYDLSTTKIEDEKVVLAGPELIEENLVGLQEAVEDSTGEVISEEVIEEEITEEVVEEVETTEYDIPDTFVNPETGNTVRYKGGKTLERSNRITYGEAGEINDLAEPDKDGFMKLDDRYLIAVGSRFDTVPGQYIDLVLDNGIVIECIMGDAKADCDTDSTNTFTYRSRCCSEFIIDKHTIRSDIKERGNASLKYSTWDSPVDKVIVYDQYHE